MTSDVVATYVIVVLYIVSLKASSKLERTIWAEFTTEGSNHRDMVDTRIRCSSHSWWEIHLRGMQGRGAAQHSIVVRNWSVYS